MKTMEFELSYEAKTWAKQERMRPRDECMTLRPCTITGIRRLASGEVPLLSGGNLSPLSADFDLESGFPSTTFRHSSPPEANWGWSENGQAANEEEELGVTSPGLGATNTREDQGQQLGDS